MLAAKAALAIRVDALGDGTPSIDLGAEHKSKLEARLRLLEEGNLRRISGSAKAKSKFEKYHSASEVKQYPVAGDSTIVTIKRKHSDAFSDDKKPLIEDITPADGGEHSKTKKKKVKTEGADYESVEVKQEDAEGAESQTPGKKKKKRKSAAVEGDDSVAAQFEQDISVKAEPETPTSETPTSETKKSKKKKKKHVSE